MLNKITTKMIEEIKKQRIGEDDVDDFLISQLIASGAALVALSPAHEEEGVYEVRFSFKLNTKEVKIEPLGQLKVEKLRGKTND